MGMTHVEKGQEEETHEAESMHCDGTHFQIKEKKIPDKKKLKEVIVRNWNVLGLFVQTERELQGEEMKAEGRGPCHLYEKV